MGLVDRAKNIVLSPASEWPVIAAETSGVPEIYKSYVIPLAAIGPIARFLAVAMLGGFFFASLPWLLGRMVVEYLLILIGVYLFALVISFLAPTFGGEKNFGQAFKLAAYSATPGWLAGVFHLLPMLTILVLLAAIYGIYVLYLGVAPVMKAPAEKAAAYTITIVVCCIVIGVVVGSVLMMVGRSFGFGLYGSEFGYHHGVSTSMVNGSVNDQVALQIQAAGERMQSAQKSADTQAQVNVAGNALAALAGGGGPQVDPVDQNLLKALLPDTVAGLARTGFEAQKTSMGAFSVSNAQASYGNDQGARIDLKITDMGGTRMLPMLAIWANVEIDQENDNGYEKTGKVDGRPTHETFQKNGPHGEYATVVGQRFLVQATGNKVDMSTIKGALGTIDLGKLDLMKGEGVKSGS